ncbi:hypothetical protein GIY30_10980 [Gordonia sp. HNM0687]|uniref:DUF2231 domain-containing protein n=1 Tax=Gordonia mangrovi TaxID=2665643 RepID=A0A6L7GQH1_9ACTN|nr:hypothetical protein [Gordonia mangrovi]UVF80706.1 hypothetical protein NWF22_12585 [Gordonia mangrovi]
MDTFNGLPAHPLLVHIPVVFVPLTAVMAIAVVLWPVAQRRLGVLVPLFALATLIAIPITTGAGEALQEQMGNPPFIEQHADLGAQMIYWSGPLFGLTVVWWALHNERVVAAIGSRLPSLTGRTRRVVDIVIGVAIVAVAIGSVVMVYRIGDSGARAVWE